MTSTTLRSEQPAPDPGERPLRRPARDRRRLAAVRLPTGFGQDVPVREGSWDACAFQGTFRPSQARVLAEVEALRERGGTRACVVLPPGAGKTVLGLEVVRRLARRTLVLTPNAAVQAQWLQAWDHFAPVAPHPQPATTDRALAAALTVLTCSSLSAWDRGADDQEPAAAEPAVDSAVAARRRAAVRGDAGADLLELLHPSGRALVERAAELGPWTLVLDESSHLVETWGALVPALARALGEGTFVLGLTATPGHALPPRAAAVHDALYAGSELGADLPTSLTDADVAPWQELVYATAPTPEEDAALDDERRRFAELRAELVEGRTGTLPFVDWLRRRVEERRTPDGVHPRPWRELAESEPELARAALRLVATDDRPGPLRLPDGAGLREEHATAPDALDWAVLLDAYAHEHLVPSEDPDDQRLLATVRRVLPTLGWSLTSRGLRPTASAVDRVCALSSAKTEAAAHVLETELAALGGDLRALVVCELEQRAEPPAGAPAEPLHPQAGSARAVLHALAADEELAAALRPVLVTGRTLAMRRADLADFRRSPAVRDAGFSDRLVAEPLDGVRSLVRLTAGEGWGPRVWTPMVTAWLEQGGTRVLVGTRALLGEGWDCRALDVVVDLTTTASPSAATALRGRALRRDPARPAKVADVWTVVCVADGHPRGGADHARAVRKHEGTVAPAPDGRLEVGIGHADDRLSPWVPPGPAVRAAVTARALARAGERATAHRAWEAGRPRGVEVATVRVTAARSLGLPGGIVPPATLVPTATLGTAAPAPTPYGGRRARPWPLPALAGAASAAVAGVGVDVATGAVTGAGTLVASVGVLAAGRYGAQRFALRRAPRDEQAATLGQLAAAVADALHATGGTGAGAGSVAVHRAPDGMLTVELDAPGSALFAASLDELLAPLADPRWLVSRLVLAPPVTVAQRRAVARARALGRPVDAAVAWHAVPSWLSGSRERVDAFDAAWHRHVGPGRFVLARDEEGELLLDLLRGADPFGLVSRVRTVCR